MSGQKSTKPTISLCVVFLNEERFLENCFRMTKPFVNEVIAVDTGPSTDHSVEICRKYTDKIYFNKWTNNFSEARDFAISKATCDFILFLDADEEIVLERGCTEIESLIPNALYGCPIHNVMEEQTEISNSFRLFPRLPYVRYNGKKIHENITDKLPDGKDGCTRALVKSFCIRHWGYLPDIKKAKKKDERNLNLLLLEEQDIETCYYIGQEYQILNMPEKAKSFYRKAIEQRRTNDFIWRIFSSIICRHYLILSMLHIKDPGYAYDIDFIEKFIAKLNIVDPTLLMLFGQHYSGIKDYNRARAYFQKAIDLKHLPIGFTMMSVADVTWRPHVAIANLYGLEQNILATVKHLEMAYYEQVYELEQQPAEEILDKICKAYIFLQNPGRSLKYMEKLIKLYPKQEYFINMADLLYNTGRKEEAFILYGRYCTLDQLDLLIGQMKTQKNGDLPVVQEMRKRREIEIAVEKARKPLVTATQ